MNTETENDAPQLRDYEQAKADCLAYIAELGITAEIKPNGVAETPAESKEDKPWLHFRWTCRAIKDGRTDERSANFDDYKTGIGNSTFKRNSIVAMGDYGVALENSARRGDISRLSLQSHRFTACKHLKPTPPDIADILGSYARDYVDANRAGSFEDWAGDFGYDIDSRKAEDTYRACLAQRKPLMQLGLSMAEIEKIAEYASQF